MGANEPAEEGAYMAIEGQAAEQESAYMAVAGVPGAPKAAPGGADAMYMAMGPTEQEEAMYMVVNPGDPTGAGKDDGDELYMMVDGVPPATDGPSMLGEDTGLAAFDNVMNMVEEDMKATAKYYMGSLRGTHLTPEELQEFQRKRAEKQRLKREEDAKKKAFLDQQKAFNKEREQRDRFLKSQANERKAADQQRDAYLERQKMLNLQRDQFIAQQHQQQKRLHGKTPEQAAREQRFQQTGSMKMKSPSQMHQPPPFNRGGGMNEPPPPPARASGGGPALPPDRNSVSSDAMRQAFLLEQARRNMDDQIVPSMEYMVKAENREEAEAMLKCTNMSEGCFLLRVKSAVSLCSVGRV